MRKLAALVAQLLAARPIPKRSLLLLLATALVAPLPAHAATVTFGFWDNNGSTGGVVQPIETTGDGTNTISHFYLGNNWGGVTSWVSNPVTSMNSPSMMCSRSSTTPQDSTRPFKVSRRRFHS